MAGLSGRDVGLTTASAMIGAGIFVAPGRMVEAGAHPSAILALFLVGGCIALAGAFIVGRLATVFPGSGGPYRYLGEAFGPRTAFLFQWSRFGVMQTAAVAVLARTATAFLAQAFGWSGPMSDYWETVAAMGLVLAAAGLNAAGLRLGRAVQAALTLLKVVILLAFSMAAFTLGDLSWQGQGRSAAPGTWMLLAIFAFGGWTQITFMAGELDDPRKLPRPLASGVLGVTILYLVALAAMLASMPSTGPGDQLAITVAGSLFGETGQRVVAVAIAVAVLGGLHTFTMTGARLYQAAAQDGGWWRPFARSNRFGAPGTSLAYQALWSCFLLAGSLLVADAFTALIASVSTGSWLFHGLLGLAWFRTRDRPAAFDTPGRAWTAGTFTLLAGAIVVAGLIQDGLRIAEGAWDELGAVWALAVLGLGALIPVRRQQAPPEPIPAPF